MNALWGKIKAFMKREDAAEWTMAVLTFFLVVLTIATTWFNCRQISIYEDATHTEHRAYLTVLGPTYHRDQLPYLSIPVKNFGHTEARQCAVLFGRQFEGTILDSLNIGKIGQVIGPGGEDEVVIEDPFKPVPGDLSPQIESGQRRFILFGMVEYVDIYGEKQCMPFRFVSRRGLNFVSE